MRSHAERARTRLSSSIERASSLARVYTAIENEIRSQWLIAYQSSHAGEEYRTVEVELARPGIEARTIRGYYP